MTCELAVLTDWQEWRGSGLGAGLRWCVERDGEFKARFAGGSGARDAMSSLAGGSLPSFVERSTTTGRCWQRLRHLQGN